MRLQKPKSKRKNLGSKLIFSLIKVNLSSHLKAVVAVDRKSILVLLLAVIVNIVRLAWRVFVKNIFYECGANGAYWNK